MKKNKNRQKKPDAETIAEFLDAGDDLIPLHRPGHTTRRGDRVLKRGKSPRDGNWRRRAYKRREVFENAEAGGNTGVRLRADQLVLDVDPRNMPEGDDVLARFAEDLGLDLSKYLHVVTGSGGSHYYMSKPDDVLVRDSLEDYPGLEFKSLGRQVVSAGSVHQDTGRYYVVDLEGPPPSARRRPVPENMLNLIRRPTPLAHGSGGEHTAEEVAAMLEGLEPEDFRDQDRWFQLMSACHKASGGDARQEFVDWSTGDPEYSDHGPLIGRRWDSLDPNVRGGVGYKTLHKFLRDAGKGDLVPAADAEDDFAEVGADEDDSYGPDLAQERMGALERMNEVYTAADDRGRFRIVASVVDPSFSPPRRYWQRYTRWDLEQINTDTMRTKKGKTVRVAQTWMDWKGRRTVQGIVFDPEREHKGFLNLWQGWAVEPRRGDWSLLRQLIEENLSDGHAEQSEYILNWCAQMFQRPGSPAESALVLRGEKGTGKGTLGKVLAAVCGVHGLHVTSSEHLTGRFNSHLNNCIFMFADESIAPHDQAANARLKGLITEPTLAVEGKGVDLVTVKNMIHIMMATNDEWAVPASLEDERRYFCGDVNGGRRGDSAFFDRLYAQLAAGGTQAFLFDMLNRDISGWHPRGQIPVTASTVRQKVLNLRPIAQFWFDLLWQGVFPFEPASADGVEWDGPFGVKVFKQDLREAFEEFARRNGFGAGGMGRGQDVVMIRDLRALIGDGLNTDRKARVPEDRPEVKALGDGRAWVYQIPPLAECRAEMERQLGGPAGWPVERKKKER